MDENFLHRRHELVRRKNLASLQALQQKELDHSLSHEEYLGVLLDPLYECELELVEIEREYRGIHKT